MCYNNTWGTVCDNMWSNLDAQVVCRQLGLIGMILQCNSSRPTIDTDCLDAGGVALSNAYYGQGNVSLLLDNMNCIGSENSLLNCSNSGVGVTSCTHAHDASVNCTGNGIAYTMNKI